MADAGHCKPTLLTAAEKRLTPVRVQPSHDNCPAAAIPGRPPQGLQEGCLPLPDGAFALSSSCSSTGSRRWPAGPRCCEPHRPARDTHTARPDGYLATAAGACGDLDKGCSNVRWQIPSCWAPAGAMLFPAHFGPLMPSMGFQKQPFDCSALGAVSFPRKGRGRPPS